MIFDPVYFLFVLPGLALSMWASMRVKSAFKKYSKVRSARGLSGARISVVRCTHPLTTGSGIALWNASRNVLRSAMPWTFAQSRRSPRTRSIEESATGAGPQLTSLDALCSRSSNSGISAGSTRADADGRKDPKWLWRRSSRHRRGRRRPSRWIEATP